MLKVMDGVSRARLLMLSCLTVLPITVAKGQATLVPPCEVQPKVLRGTAWRSAPGQNLTLTCRVQHCGERVNVTWCKLSGSAICEQMEEMPGVEIKQSDDRELTFSLTFYQISGHQDGLYRCVLSGNNFIVFSHNINISVSDNYTGITREDPVNSAGEMISLLTAGGNTELHYFYICFGFILIITTLTALTYLSFYYWERRATRKKIQEMRPRTQPDLYTTSSASLPLPQAKMSSVSATRASLEPPNKERPATATAAAGDQGSDSSTYSVLSFKTPGQRAGGQPVATDKGSSHSAISVSGL